MSAQASAKKRSILCIGAGYVGGPTMAMIAAKCPDRKVTVVDIDKFRIAAWQSDQLPIYEPGLPELVAQSRGRNLFFSTDIAEGISDSDIIFVSVNTPTKTFGQGAGRAADLQYWEKTARQIRECSTEDKIVVEKSTLPVRTAQAMKRILHSGDSGVHFEVLSNPEFLAEGTAVARPGAPRPGADRRRADGQRPGCRGGVGGRVCHMGAARADLDDQRVEQRVVEVGGQRVPGPADQLDQQHLGAVRGDRGGRGRGGAGDRHGFADRLEVPARRRRFRRFVLQEGHSESGLPGRALRAASGGVVLDQRGRD